MLEKGSEPGAHILSGAVMDPRALNELFPNWKELGAPLNHARDARTASCSSTETRRHAHAQLHAADVLPEPRQLRRSAWPTSTRWLGQQAEALGVEIFPGFPAAEVLYNDDGSVKGVATGNMGIGKDGEPTDDFQLGMELHAKYTLFAEGSRGHLGRQLIAQLQAGRGQGSADLRHRHQGTVGDRSAKRHQPGLVMHTAGWPLDDDDLWRLVPVPHGKQPGRGRLRRRAWTTRIPTCRRSRNSSATRPIPNIRWFFEGAASRQARLLRRARDHRGRPADRCPRRCSRAARWSAATPAS